MQDFVGKQIDRYRVTERLGLGGMAVVYKAYDTRLERDVALKLIRTGSIPPDQYARLMKRFEREAKAQARFDHKHIVTVFDYGEVDSAPYLVMSYVPGGTLKAKTGKPIDWQQALRWLIPVADALSYAHKRGVIHRDIKPSNILFDDEGQAVLTDFGIAKILETDEGTLTGTGLGVGTPEYMAPEQWQGQASEATDQYALGVVLYELLTGQKPYTADTPAAVAIQQATEPLRSPRALTPGIPESVEKLLYKALAKNPQDRYADMAAFRTALEKQLTAGAEQVVESEEFFQPEPIPIAAEPKPLPLSEADTADELAPTPVESLSIRTAALPQPTRHAVTGKTKLSSRLLWAGGAVLAVALLAGGMALLARSNRGRAPTAAAEPAEVAAIQLESPQSTATETPVPIPSFSIGSTMVNPIDGALMVYVPEGEFLMGSEDEDAWDSEKPEHTVYLDAYWIHQHPVTNAQFAAFIDASGHQTTAEETGRAWVFNGKNWTETEGAYWGAPEGPGSNIADRGEHPVVQVSWYDAVAYCQWAEGRLPTEAEWEKAARGTDGRRYPWGNEPVSGDKANYCDVNCPMVWADNRQDDGYERTSPVGSYPSGVSPYGALDMAGNVWEWVADWYAENSYSRSLGKNPIGPSSGDYRVLRGGSWYFLESLLRVSCRYWNNPDNMLNNNGFRCLRSP